MRPHAPRLLLESDDAADVRPAVLAGLRAYNRLHAPPPEFRPLLATARDGDAIVGGLVGMTGWNWLHVDLLWLDDAHRGRGLGRGLLELAEREARTRGCTHADLDTFEFQARGFYERQGYVVFGVLEDYPPGSRRWYLRKDL